jgi:hypothetical protein
MDHRLAASCLALLDRHPKRAFEVSAAVGL